MEMKLMEIVVLHLVVLLLVVASTIVRYRTTSRGPKPMLALLWQCYYAIPDIISDVLHCKLRCESIDHFQYYYWDMNVVCPHCFMHFSSNSGNYCNISQEGVHLPPGVREVFWWDNGQRIIQMYEEERNCTLNQLFSYADYIRELRTAQRKLA